MLLTSSSANLFDQHRQDVPTPITPSEASAHKDRPTPIKNGPSIELGWSSGEETELYFRRNPVDVTVEECQFNNNYYLRGSKRYTEDEVDMNNMLQAQIYDSRSSKSHAKATKGSVPPFLPVHAGTPDAEANKSNRQLHVFGTDDRKVFRDISYPYSTVGRFGGRIKCSSNSCRQSFCTGTMIGPRHVLTAAHCISTDPCGSMTIFTPSYYDGDQPFGTASVTHFLHWNKNFDDGVTENEVAFDHAVLILDRMLGNVTGWMGVKDFSQSWVAGDYWSNIGYPRSLTNGSRPVYTSNGVVWNVDEYTNDGVTGKVLGTFIDVEEGHSGGPLYAYFNQSGTGEDYPSVVGVISTEALLPFRTAFGDNEASAGQRMLDLVSYALKMFP